MKISIILLLMVFIVNLVLTGIYGYLKVNPTYGGAFIYAWRSKYMDPKISKSVYKAGKLNDQAKNELFERYFNAVQKKHPEGNQFPFYAYGFPDTFVLGPQYSWTILKNSDSKLANKFLDLELKFLDSRAKFIREMYKEDKNLVYSENHPYFRQVRPDMKDEEKAEILKYKNKPILKDSNFKLITKKLNEEIINQIPFFKELYEPFNTIINKVVDKTKDYGVTFDLEKKTASMSKEFSKDVMDLVNIAFKDTISISISQVNEFFYRLAVVKPKSMDVHILNRIYFYFLYTRSFLDVSKYGNKEYDDLVQEIEDIKVEKEEKQKKNNGEEPENLKRKFKSRQKKLAQKRLELIFNQFSSLFASVIGNKASVMNKNIDKRNFLEKYSNPITLKENDKKAPKFDNSLVKISPATPAPAA